jgi:hypothetical protein
MESGGVGEWQGQKACYAYLGTALHTSSRTRTWLVMMCQKGILAQVRCGNYTPAPIQRSEWSKVLSPFSQTIIHSLAMINGGPSQT